MNLLSPKHTWHICQSTAYTDTYTKTTTRWQRPKSSFIKVDRTHTTEINGAKRHKGTINVSGDRNNTFWTQILTVLPSLKGKISQSWLATVSCNGLPWDQYKYRFQDQIRDRYLERVKRSHAEQFPIHTEGQKNILFCTNGLSGQN